MENLTFLAAYGVIVEFILIAIVMLSIVSLKFILRKRKNNLTRHQDEVKAFIDSKIKNKDTHIARFKDSWKDLEVLLAVVNHFDNSINPQEWNMMRIPFLREHVLPLARAAAADADWKMRFYATLAFSMYSENQDEAAIIELVDDDIPLVRYSAANAGIVYGSEVAMNSIVDRMSEETLLTQSIYMQAFDRVAFATHYILARMMKESTNVAMRATMYNLLLRYPVFEVSWNITKDIYSPNDLLAISAIRYFAYSQKARAVDVLLDRLHEMDWKGRAVIISCLGDIKQTSTYADIGQYLQDENWWVRNAAEQALRKFGEIGERELNLRHIKTDDVTINVDVAQYVLNTY